jgi:anhydro-N-acetylmuramic acid kinase
MKKIPAIGMMSGSSLDGLDIAYAYFQKDNGWEYEWVEGATYPFPEYLRTQLVQCRALNGQELILLDQELGDFMAQQIQHFLKSHQLDPPRVIGNHGHTVFHQPEKGYSLQIGNNQLIGARLGITLVGHFRSQDIWLGGQGAPLVPIGDLQLFSEYDACLNLGGIANLSVKKDLQIRAWDLAACNQVLDHLSQRKGIAYDENGRLGREGIMIPDWLEALRKIPFHLKAPPKSLSNEQVQQFYLDPLPQRPVTYLLHTYYHFLADHISRQIKSNLKGGRILLTGGGAHNHYLVEQLKDYLIPDFQVIVPEDYLVNFKEAIVFAFMGVLRLDQKINVLSSVTGATRDSSSGVVFHPG